MNMKPQSLRSERGAIIIHVALALLVLLAFCAFSVDAGLLWAARRQAQNSADAGALAGAISLAFDDYFNRDDDGPAKQAAYRVTQQNGVWREAPDVVVATDVTFPDALPAPAACVVDEGELSPCVRVDVYRNQTRGNPLPTFFGRLVGVTDQGVRATATALAAMANSTDCLKPWAIADKWLERRPDNPGTWSSGWDGETATTPSSFDRYDIQGQTVTLKSGDVDEYTPPTEDSPGTGFTLANDYGRKMSLKVGQQSDKTFSSGWFLALDLPEEDGGSPGAAGYMRNIKGCDGTTFKIGEELTLNNEPGNKIGPTRQAVSTDPDSLVNKDPGAWWDSTMNNGKGGVRGSAYAISPRIVPVPLIDLDDYIRNIPNGKQTAKIVNVLGFFVKGMGDPAQGENQNEVIGYLMTMPGFKKGNAVPIGEQSSFLKNVILVR